MHVSWHVHLENDGLQIMQLADVTPQHACTAAATNSEFAGTVASRYLQFRPLHVQCWACSCSGPHCARTLRLPNPCKLCMLMIHIHHCDATDAPASCGAVPGTQLQWTASRKDLEDELQAANSHPAPPGDTDMHRLEQRLGPLHLDMCATTVTSVFNWTLTAEPFPCGRPPPSELQLALA